MNVQERNNQIKKFFDVGMSILEKKGKDYNPNGVAFDEIYREASDLGMTPQAYMSVLMSKHWGAIKTFCKTSNLTSEPIGNRLLDLANYCALMAVMLEDPHNPEVVLNQMKQALDGPQIGRAMSIEELAPEPSFVGRRVKVYAFDLYPNVFEALVIEDHRTTFKIEYEAFNCEVVKKVVLRGQCRTIEGLEIPNKK